MIRELYEKAGMLHGHHCPGLAIGVRAGFEANRILEIESRGHHLYCIAEGRACHLDGVQMAFGATMGNGNLELKDMGKTAFNFYDRHSGKSVRLILRALPDDMSRDEMKVFILEAPFDEVFIRSETSLVAPPDIYKPVGSGKCSVCGESCKEPYLRFLNGAPVCLVCEEKFR